MVSSLWVVERTPAKPNMEGTRSLIYTQCDLMPGVESPKVFTFPALGMDPGRSKWKLVHLQEIMMHQVEGAKSNFLKSAEDIVVHLGHGEGHPEIEKVKARQYSTRLFTWWPDCLGYKLDGGNQCRWFLIEKCVGTSAWRKLKFCICQE